MPLILPGNVASATASVGYDVANSCRFNSGDSAYMTKALGTPSSQKQFTFSAWIKRGVSGANMSYFSAGSNGDSVYTSYRFQSANTMRANVYSAGGDTLLTDQLFRDHAAWYHVVITVDTPNAVEADRIRFYVNGTRLTGPWGEEGYPAQDDDIASLASGEAIEIGRRIRDDTMYFDGYMADVVFCDGQAYDASDFGLFDSDSPTIWKPKDPSGLTFGNNGFWLDFEDSANLGNDANGGTDLTESNLDATDQATDTPTNNFCTMNPLANYINGSTFTDGNNTMTTANNTRSYNIATMGLTSGKWYFETYMNELVSGPGQNTLIGIADAETTNLGNQLGILASQYAYYATTGGSYNSNTDTGYGDTYTTGNYIGTYIDLDNNKIYWAKDGVIQNSGTGVTITAASGTPGGAYLPALGFWSNIPIYKYNLNFGGCPSFAISSGNADANGYGNFEYDPSDGGGSSFDSAAKDFLAICTKNLGSDGG
jgi:hypothetical protein